MLAFLIFTALCCKAALAEESCSSKVYCHGDLLHTVQMARIFNDSKIFVDLKMKQNEQITWAKFRAFKDQNKNPSREEIRIFVNNNFENENALETYTPFDYKDNPSFLLRIRNSEMRKFAYDLNKMWRALGRRIKSRVFQSKELYSIIPVSQGFIYPGGDFREFNYWGSLWIVQGLLLCEMHETVRGMLENYFIVIEQYGYIPKGGRIYYLDRSGPSLLTQMVKEYYLATNDLEWLRKNVKYIEIELKFWLQYRMIEVEKNGKKHQLCHYSSKSHTPRPEKYYEDVKSWKEWHDSDQSDESDDSNESHDKGSKEKSGEKHSKEKSGEKGSKEKSGEKGHKKHSKEKGSKEKSGEKHSKEKSGEKHSKEKSDEKSSEEKSSESWGKGEKWEYYKDINSASESGWDFSSRWIINENGGNNGDLIDIKTRRIIPVDLNAFLCEAFGILANFYLELGDVQKANYWRTRHETWMVSIYEVFYDEDDKIWYDFDVKLKRSRKYFYPSNFAPLWSKTYDQSDHRKYVKGVLKYIEKQGIENYEGGIPTSYYNSGQKWDLPNAFSSLQHIVIVGLYNSGDDEAMQVAVRLGKIWLQNTYEVYKKTGKMYGKYNARSFGEVGSSEGYNAENGFAMTNGVVLQFIHYFY